MDLQDLVNKYSGFFVVNYENFDVIYSEGYENKNGLWCYKISDLNKIPEVDNKDNQIPNAENEQENGENVEANGEAVEANGENVETNSETVETSSESVNNEADVTSEQSTSE